MKKIITALTAILLITGCSAQNTGKEEAEKPQETAEQPQETPAEVKKHLVAEYDGSKEDGVVLDANNTGIHVYLEDDNGNREPAEGWEIRQPKTLESGETAAVVIWLDGSSVVLKVTGEGEKKPDFAVDNPIINRYTDIIGNTYLTVYFPIRNTGKKDLYLSGDSISLEDADGHLLDTVRMVSCYPQIIQPGETGWFLGQTTSQIDSGTELRAVPNGSAAMAKVSCIRYDVSDVTLRNGQLMGVEMIGRVKNNTNESGSLVYVTVVLFDKNNQPLGNMFTILDGDLPAGGETTFEMTNMLSPGGYRAEDVDHYEIWAYPHQYQF